HWRRSESVRYHVGSPLVEASSHLRKWRNWQTHQLEGLALARAWGVESPLPHQDSTSLTSRRGAPLVRRASRARRRAPPACPTSMGRRSHHTFVTSHHKFGCRGASVRHEQRAQARYCDSPIWHVRCYAWHHLAMAARVSVCAGGR